jgi:ArsR family transcriptional regulator
VALIAAGIRDHSSIVVESTTLDVRADVATAPGLLAVVADPVRWRLLAALGDGETRCVCELAPIGGVASNVLSYHLKVLREAALVTATRRGRWVDYTLHPDAAARVHRALPLTGGPV